MAGDAAIWKDYGYPVHLWLCSEARLLFAGDGPAQEDYGLQCIFDSAPKQDYPWPVTLPPEKATDLRGIFGYAPK